MERKFTKDSTKWLRCPLDEKGGQTHYRYKDHVKADTYSKLIHNYAIALVNTHDSNEFEDFFNEQNEVGYIDSALRW